MSPFAECVLHFQVPVGSAASAATASAPTAKSEPNKRSVFMGKLFLGTAADRNYPAPRGERFQARLAPRRGERRDKSVFSAPLCDPCPAVRRSNVESLPV